MNSLSNTIYNYYWAQFSDLPLDKQFHFASRLYLWQRDEASYQALQSLRPWFTHHQSPRLAIQQVIAEAQASPLHGSKNAAEMRACYFEQYPLLKTYVSVLFRITFLKTIYQVDASDLFHSYFPAAQVAAFSERLLDDSAALRILSTHAVNFLYLYHGLVNGDLSIIQPSRLLLVGQSGYDSEQPVQLQLLIYFYTHCVIGESLFYSRALPEARLVPYQTMLAQLEDLISAHFSAINLDNKFEFLVCAELTGYHSGLRDRILQEADASLSTAGDFLIDRHNNNQQAENVTLDSSEHRNVLFLMANSSFRPLFS